MSRKLYDNYFEDLINLFPTMNDYLNIPKYSHLKKLWEIQSKAEQKGMLGVALRAEELRGKTKGLYVDYSKNMNINKNGLDDLTTEELEARMKGTLEHYSKISTVKEEEYDKDKHSKADD